MHNNQNMLINDILFIITLIWMHVNTEKGKNKKEVNVFFCSLSVNNSMYVNSQSKNIHNKFLWLNREANHQAHKRAPRLPIHAMTSDLYTYNHTQTHNRPVNQHCRSSWYMPQPQPHFPSDTPTDNIKQRLKMFISTLTNIYNILLYQIPIVRSKIMNIYTMWAH